MEYGVCSDLSQAAILKKAGFDYLELNVQRDLKPELPDDDFQPVLELINASPLPCRCANCFIPGHLKLTGDNVNSELLSQYVTVACARAALAGIDTIVFGSGAARCVPDGFDREEARAQLILFVRQAGDIAHGSGITLCVEPLNRAECNILNRVEETARFVIEAAHPRVHLLVDAYHWDRENELAEPIIIHQERLSHTHIATYRERKAPGLEPCDFDEFFSALAHAGYDGRMSIEGQWDSLDKEAAHALAVLKDCERAVQELLL